LEILGGLPIDHVEVVNGHVLPVLDISGIVLTNKCVVIVKVVYQCRRVPMGLPVI
jgi:hypothetical protein